MILIVGAFVGLSVLAGALTLLSPWVVGALLIAAAVLSWVERERQINQRVKERLALAEGQRRDQHAPSGAIPQVTGGS